MPIDNEYLDYGMDFVEIFKRYLPKKTQKETKIKVEDIDVEIRKMYDNQFFKEYFNVEESTRLMNSSFMLIGHGLKAELLKEKNEIDLIQFLLDMSKEFNSYKEVQD